MADDPFKTLWALGYKRLVPIIPPKARVSPSSNYSRDSSALGKAVGVLGENGWYGFNWTASDPSDENLKQWARMGAGVGIKAGPLDPSREDSEWLVFIDSDTLDVDLARTVDRKVHEHFGPLPCRIGKQPKALYPIRVCGPIRYMRVGFGGVTESGRPRHAVEILAGMKQAVMPPSIHPETGQAYYWARPLVPVDQLPVTTPERLKAFMDDLRATLPSPVATTGALATTPADRAKIDQEGLRGDPELVERAVRAIPNTLELFPTYESMTKIGLAIHGALPDDPDRGLEIFTEWCAKWDGEGFDPRRVEKYWNTYHPPHLVGASYLYREAAKLAPEKFSIAWQFFDEIPDDMEFPEIQKVKSLFGTDTEMAGASAPIVAAAFRWPSCGSIPPRDWLYGHHLIRKFISATIAPGGVGKSSLLIGEALAMISGGGLLGGVKPLRPLNVWLWNGEDPLEEMERRIAAAAAHFGLSADECPGKLFLNSGRDTPLIIAESLRNGAVSIAHPVVAALKATITANAIDVLVIDPFVSSHRVSENDNMAIEIVARQWAMIADETNCAIELVHHTRKTGGEEVTIEAARGASALMSAARAARAINPMTEEEAAKAGVTQRSRYFRSDDGKANLSPPSDKAQWFRFESIDMGNAADGRPSDKVGVVTAWDWPAPLDGVTGADLNAVEAEMSSKRWRKDPRASSWVGQPIARALGLDLDDKAQSARVAALIKEWLKAGVLREMEGFDASRRPKTFIEFVCQTQDKKDLFA